MDAWAIYDKQGPEGADEAMAALNACLTNDPDDQDALTAAARIQYDAGRFGMADVLLRHCLRVNQANSSAWLDLGRCQHARQESERAARSFVNAMRVTGDRFVAYNNLLLINNTLGYPERTIEMAPMARFLVDSPEDAADLNGNVGIACLMLRRWKEGWINYDGLLRPDMLRKEMVYEVNGKPLPRWDGTPGGEVIVWGEQGLGDEKLFASMIPDMIAAGTTPIIDCDKRLGGLFGRSFDCPVYATRSQKTEKEWLKRHAPKAAIGIGSLGQFYRQKEADFPRRPYLVADPAKRAMCRALLDQWPGRKIGIAWTAGTKKTRTFDRSLTMAELEPLLQMEGVTFVNLEYKGEPVSDQRIKDVSFLTQSRDYDDTAALVAELDAVVCPTTTVAFLAGALGVPCHVLVPEAPTWHWCKFGEFPWFDLKLYRRVGPSWDLCVARVKEALGG